MKATEMAKGLMLGGLIGALSLSGSDLVAATDDQEANAEGWAEECGGSAGSATRTEFPLLAAVLFGKYSGYGWRMVSHKVARRLVTIDMEDPDDWGDLSKFWDGEDMVWGLGNDSDGYWKIERVFEIVEPTVELHERRFPVAYELTFEQLAELVDEVIKNYE